MATQYIGLTLATPSVSTGPGWATTLNTALSTIDAHDHSTGKGAYVTPSGLDLNADVSFMGRTTATAVNATSLRSARFFNNTSQLSTITDVNAVWVSGGNLFFSNSGGTAVQITSGASLSAAGTGSISGLSSPASAAYASGSGTFTWTSNTNVAASMDHGPLTIRDTASSAAGITLKSPTGIAGAYSLTLPGALPSNAGLLQLSTAGVISAFGTISGSDLTLAGIVNLSLASNAYVKATSANTQLNLIGNRNASDASADVAIASTATRSAGYLLAIQNPSTVTNKLLVDYQGLLTLGSQSGPLQPSSLYTTIVSGGTWGNSSGAAYWKDATGTVHCKGGMIEQLGGSSSNPAFTFPAGFRPAATRYFTCIGIPSLGGTAAVIWQLTSAGALNLISGATASLDVNYIDGISFAAEG